MDSIFNHLYLVFFIGIISFALTAGAVGYLIGLRQATKTYNELKEIMEDDFIETLKCINGLNTDDIT